jgi:hypothetical protein
MHMLDADRKQSVRVPQLYLSTREATELRDALMKLCRHPEETDHEHVFAEDMSREISLSIVTPTKLVDLSRYTELERKILRER